MTFQDLQREFEVEVIGVGIWEMILAVTKRALRNAASSYEEIEEIAQQVTTDLLLGENQLAYAFANATDEDHLRGLIGLQIRRMLFRRRSGDAVNRLLRRVRVICGDPPFETIRAQGLPEWFRRIGTTATYRVIDVHELRKVVCASARIERLTEMQSADRASQVYTKRNLAALVAGAVDATDGLSADDLRFVFRNLLTWEAPAILEGGEGRFVPSREKAERLVEMSSTVEAIEAFVTSTEVSDCRILLLKNQNFSDAEVGARVGRSRPWVADRHRSLAADLRAKVMTEVPEDLHEPAVRLLLDRISARIDEAGL